MFTGIPLLHRHHVDSTMTWIHRELETGTYPDGLLCRADHQEAGRGRVIGRRWLDEPGASFLATITLPVERVVSGTVHRGTTAALATGLAVARMVESYVDGRVAIKWPNDVLVSGRKIAGLILERTADWLLLGIGLNLRQREFPPEIGDRATSILMESDGAPAAAEVVAPLLDALDDAFVAPDWLNEVTARLHRRNEVVSIVASEFAGVARGKVAGIGSDGALLIRDLRLADGSVREEWSCYSGEVVPEGARNR